MHIFRTYKRILAHSHFSEATEFKRRTSEPNCIKLDCEWTAQRQRAVVLNTSPNTRALLYPYMKMCQRKEKIKRISREKLAVGRWSWLDHLAGVEVDWILLGGTKWMLGQKTVEVPLSSTDSLIKDLEDDNRLDMGLRAASVWFRLQGKPSHRESKLI